MNHSGILNRHILLGVLLIAIDFVAQAQSGDLRFKRVTTETGKSIGGVRCLLYDSHNYMWMGSGDTGFIRFDGTRAREYLPVELSTDQFNSSFVWLIFEDRRRNLWIGTDVGAIMRYDRNLDRFELMNDSTSSVTSPLYSYVEDGDGNFWIGSLGGGLLYFNPNTKTSQVFKANPGDSTSLYDNYITGLALDAKDRLWIGTTGGLCSYDRKGNFHRHPLTNSNPEDTYRYQVIRKITPASDGSLYISSYGGLHRFYPETGIDEHFIHDEKNSFSISHNSLFGAAEGADGELWIATYGGGLNRFDPVSKKFRHWRKIDGNPESLSSDNIFSVYRSSNGLLWVGAADNTINLYNPSGKPLHTLQQQPGKANSICSGWVRSILQEDDSTFWMGFNGNGLNRLNLNTGIATTYIHDPGNVNSLAHNTVVDIDNDTQQNIWIGLEGGGINVFNKRTGKFTRYQHGGQNSINNNAVSAMIVDQDDRVWAATYRSGLNIFDPKRNRFYSFSEDSLKSSGISFGSTLEIQELNNSIWFNTHRGIVIYDKGKQIFLKIPDKGAFAPSNFATLVDIVPFSENEMLLFTSSDIRLIHYTDPQNIETKTLFSLPAEQGKVLSFVVDQEKLIWYITRDILVRLNWRTQEVKQYTKEDGLLKSDFSLLTIDKSGRIFITTRDGINWFFPKELQDDKTPCTVVFNDFKLYNHSVPIQKIDSITDFYLPRHISQLREITLRHNHSFFSIGFTALEYMSPSKIQYAYKLDGFDRDWVYVGNQNFASYTNLNPGRYNFLVKAANPDGYWSDPISLSVNIKPPFWKTAWFLILAIATIVSLIYAVHQYRLSNLLKIERLRTKIASDLHDEVGSSLTRLSIYSDLVRDEQDELERKNYLQRISSVSREVVGTMSDIVWSVDSKSDNAESLFLRMKEYAADVLSSKGIEFAFSITGINEKDNIDLMIRQNLYLIFKEAITNAVKHAQATHVNIEITQNAGTFTMTISDNGIGFNSAQENGGHGLRNIQRRADSIQAKVEFVNSNGCTITLSRKAQR